MAAETLLYNLSERRFMTEELRRSVKKKTGFSHLLTSNHIRMLNDLSSGQELHMKLYPQRDNVIFGAVKCNCSYKPKKNVTPVAETLPLEIGWASAEETSPLTRDSLAKLSKQKSIALDEEPRGISPPDQRLSRKRSTKKSIALDEEPRGISPPDQRLSRKRSTKKIDVLIEEAPRDTSSPLRGFRRRSTKKSNAPAEEDPRDTSPPLRRFSRRSTKVKYKKSTAVFDECPPLEIDLTSGEGASPPAPDSCRECSRSLCFRCKNWIECCRCQTPNFVICHGCRSYMKLVNQKHQHEARRLLSRRHRQLIMCCCSSTEENVS